MGKVVSLNANEFQEMDYMEETRKRDEQIEELNEQALVKQQEAENIKLGSLDGNKVLETISDIAKLALEANNKADKLDVRLRVVEKDLDERKNLCDDQEVQALNSMINSSVQSVLCKYKLVGKQGEKNYRTATYNIIRGQLKKTYYIRFWAQGHTVIPKTLYKTLSLAIPQIAKGVSLEDIKNRAKNYKESQDERKEKEEEKAIENAKQEGRVEELIDGRIVITKKN